MHWTEILAAAIAVVLVVHLGIALLAPEKFS